MKVWAELLLSSPYVTMVNYVDFDVHPWFFTSIVGYGGRLSLFSCWFLEDLHCIICPCKVWMKNPWFCICELNFFRWKHAAVVFFRCNWVFNLEILGITSSNMFRFLSGTYCNLMISRSELPLLCMGLSCCKCKWLASLIGVTTDVG